MNVVLGVGGGIAAYKAAELCRALQERGCTVQVVMTAAAQEFITPLTFAALTGRKVISGLFDHSSAEAVLSSSVEHIAVARDHAMLVVAPATADLLARFAHGLAGDFLSTLYLAFTGEVVLAPAMNSEMWRHPATAGERGAVARAGAASFCGSDRWVAGLWRGGSGAAGRASSDCRGGDGGGASAARPGGRGGADHGRADAGAD